MRILWHSNSPWSGSGYGNQTDLFSRLLHQAGHEVIIRAFYGLQSAKLNYNGIEVLPAGLHAYGEDVLEGDWHFYKPDAHVLLIDLWVYSLQILTKLPLTSWCPIDHDPLPPMLADRLPYMRHIWAMSRFGERKMREQGLDPHYVPHGVETRLFTPINHTAGRPIIGVEDDTFLVACVMANKGNPPRKNLDRIVKAWGQFVEKHPKARMWMHTFPYKAHDGVDVHALMEFYGVPKDSILFPDVYRFLRGDYTSAWLNQLYNSADVLLHPARGEGFGIPIIEAQASGCPVIVSDFSAMSELGEQGYKIALDPVDDYEWTYQQSENAVPSVSKIITSLEWALENKGNEILRANARDFAMQYDARHVLERYMLPALESGATYDSDLIGARENAS